MTRADRQERVFKRLTTLDSPRLDSQGPPTPPEEGYPGRCFLVDININSRQDRLQARRYCIGTQVDKAQGRCRRRGRACRFRCCRIGQEGEEGEEAQGGAELQRGGGRVERDRTACKQINRWPAHKRRPSVCRVTQLEQSVRTKISSVTHWIGSETGLLDRDIEVLEETDEIITLCPGARTRVPTSPRRSPNIVVTHRSRCIS